MKAYLVPKQDSLPVPSRAATIPKTNAAISRLPGPTPRSLPTTQIPVSDLENQINSSESASILTAAA